ncbi:prepilin-type N-terminal cleavage/methylation domain-containing protein [Vibrio sp. CAU 1672]|uniref:type IV pilus modification PilV family protein n=1 Tax=Vibrio sp. CAU 1672 TaxID=3032594 RepID=UPI0023DA9059|nr:prepilin-type N-terminal cleavage/methylation domain-containing protein [Vibrio sp. CAU 1672]MDF2154223.1 prepilin-type N-terminal cleavage/methylation domain-containing protein [Vibrio sp. CAU 1672]
MRNKPKWMRRQTGFSLIEVLISFVLIGVGAMGLIKLQTYAEQQADYAKRSVDALNLAESKLEWFRTRGASAALSTLPVADFATDIIPGMSVSAGYTLSWEVPSSTVSGSVKTIVIEASWDDRSGQVQSVQLKTMIARYSEFD